MFKAHITQAKFMFFVTNESVPQVDQGLFANWTEQGFQESDIVQGIGHILVYTIRYFGAYFIDLFMIMMAGTMCLGVHRFVKETMINKVAIPVKINKGFCYFLNKLDPLLI